MRNLILSSLFLTSILVSCNEDPAFVEPDAGYDHYPLNQGAYIIYDVDSIVYNDFTGNTEEYNYQIKKRTR